MATMRDVAERAGVSIATVSFVLNGTKPVTAATRARIEQAMAELGFRRNLLARALASRRTHILAMAYPALRHRFGGSAAEFFTGAAEAARRRDYHLVLWPVDNDGAELTELVGQGLVDGVVLMEVQLDDPRVGVLRSTGTPFALIGRTADLDGIAHVDIDFDTTVEVAAAHLYELGHRRIALLSGQLGADPSFVNYGPYVRTEAAYRRVMTGYGLPELVLEYAPTARAGREAAVELAREHPGTTAVLTMNEHAAVGLVAGLNRLSHAVPAQVSVLSLITAQDMGALADPELTFMRSPGPELGRLGIEALIRLLDGEDPPPPELIPGTLEPGGTTGPAPRASG